MLCFHLIKRISQCQSLDTPYYLSRREADSPISRSRKEEPGDYSTNGLIDELDWNLYKGNVFFSSVPLVTDILHRLYQ